MDVPARMQVRGSGSEEAAPVVAGIDAATDEVSADGALTLVTAGRVEIAVARIVGTPLGDGPRLTGTIGDSGDTLDLAVLRSR